MKKNFRLLALALGFSAAMPSFAQKENVGIGTTKPDQSAVLDLSSTNKGLLMPRMSLQQRNAIQSPAQGLIVYQTDILSGFYFYNGKDWKSIGLDKSVAGIDGDWAIGGNNLTAVPVGDRWLGTSSNHSLLFKVNNTKSGELNTATASTFYGYQAGIVSTGFDNVGLGQNALYTNTSGNQNIAVGNGTLFSNNGRNNVAIGHFAMNLNTSGESNMSIGSFSLQKNTTGAGNMAIGVNALRENTLGSLNTAVGTQALFSLTGANASYNTAIGESALYGNTSGNRNTAVGYEAGRNNTEGVSNVFIGHWAGKDSGIENNKLYISNTETTLPLVYGDFSAKFISIGDVGVAGDAAATLVKRNNLSTQYGLLVQKGILTEKIKVATMTTTDWADYVFEKDYKRMTLEEVEKFVNENKHLPNVPTTTEMISNGSDLIKTDAKLLEKIEELTLYMIEMNKEIKALKAENEKLKK